MLNKVYNPLLSYRGDIGEVFLPKFAIKQAEETPELEKIDEEKIIRVWKNFFFKFILENFY